MDRLESIPRDFFWLTAMSLLAEACGALGAAGPAGLLAAAQSDMRAAASHLEHALRLCATAGAPAFEARARADLAGLERHGARSLEM